MPRLDNPYVQQTGSPYGTDPRWGQAARSLGTALFGDPQMAEAQRVAQAKLDRDKAEALNFAATGRLSDAKTADQMADTGYKHDIVTRGDNIYLRPPAAQPALASVSGAPESQAVPFTVAQPPAAPAGTVAGGVAQDQVDRYTLGQIAARLSVLGQDPTKFAGTVGAFSGNDADSRAAVIAQGGSPSADFAINAQAAQTMEALAAQQKRDQEESVHNIDGGYAVKVGAGHDAASRYGANASAGAEIAVGRGHDAVAMRGQNMDSGDRKYAVDHQKPPNPYDTQPGVGAAVDSEINASIGVRYDNNGIWHSKSGMAPLPAELQSKVRVRAVEIARTSGNMPGAVAQALGELVQTDHVGGHRGFDGNQHGGRDVYAPRSSAPKPQGQSGWKARQTN